MIDVKAGRVCRVALSEYLIKTPHTKAEMMSKVCFCVLLPLNPAWFGSSLSSPPSLHSIALPFSLCFFSSAFTAFSPIKLNQRPACFAPAVIVAHRVRWNPCSAGLTSSAFSFTLLEPNKDIFIPSLLICSHAFTLSLVLPTPDNHVTSLASCGRDLGTILCCIASEP